MVGGMHATPSPQSPPSPSMNALSCFFGDSPSESLPHKGRLGINVSGVGLGLKVGHLGDLPGSLSPKPEIA